MELSNGVRPTVPCYVKRDQREQYYGRSATCSECNVAFLVARPSAKTCSPACRQRRKRRVEKEEQERQRMHRELKAAGMPVKRDKKKSAALKSGKPAKRRRPVNASRKPKQSSAQDRKRPEKKT